MDISLRGVIFDRFANISTFAKAVGWNRKKASDIVNGRRRPSARDMEDIARVADIQDDNTFMALFFGRQVHNVD